MYIVAAAKTARGFLLPHLKHLVREGEFEAVVVCSPGPELESFAGCAGIRVVAVPIQREIAPLKDLVSLLQLWRVIRRERPALVNAGTPKGGLLGMLAAWAAKVPCRVYTHHGLRLETSRGWQRRLLWAADKLACVLASRVVAVSQSLAERLTELGICPQSQVLIIGHGSWGGVRAERFEASVQNLPRAAQIRQELRIPEGPPVVGFVGRLTRDKGIAELVCAYQMLRAEKPDLKLLLVGDFEDGDPVDPDTRRTIVEDPGIVKTGFVNDAAPYYHLMTVLAFPSYREGFPNVPLEAAAAGVPVVAARVTGTVDAVVDGVTGLLVPVGDPEALAEGIRRLLEDRALAARLAETARERAVRDFQPERIWDELAGVYRELLERARERRARRMGLRLKQAVDLAGAAVGLLIAAPLIAAVAAAVRAAMGSPVLHRQKRTGLGEREFELLKFRTMIEQHGPDARLLPDEVRLTPLGRFLRRWSLDELPQLWNVLRGEMSLVGPRPLPPEYLPRYTAFQRRRHEVKPGITGWAQVNGRNALTWEQKFELDVWYVEHQSLWLDLRILWKTLVEVLRGEGINYPGFATMPRFGAVPPRDLSDAGR
jgi:lipopolysaccharide/colanic/teichoic acid biosynthesis glycosyltransferase/glycosyltransferase involved in cell wall biosynthesis